MSIPNFRRKLPLLKTLAKLGLSVHVDDQESRLSNNSNSDNSYLMCLLGFPISRMNLLTLFCTNTLIRKAISLL